MYLALVNPEDILPVLIGMTSWCKPNRYPPTHRYPSSAPLAVNWWSYPRRLHPPTPGRMKADVDRNTVYLGWVPNKKCWVASWNGAFSPHIWSATDLVSPAWSWTARGLSQQHLGVNRLLRPPGTCSLDLSWWLQVFASPTQPDTSATWSL